MKHWYRSQSDAGAVAYLPSLTQVALSLPQVKGPHSALVSPPGSQQGTHLGTHTSYTSQDSQWISTDLTRVSLKDHRGSEISGSDSASVAAWPASSFERFARIFPPTHPGETTIIKCETSGLGRGRIFSRFVSALSRIGALSKLIPSPLMV